MKQVLLGIVVAVVLFFSGFLTRQCTFKLPEPEIKTKTDTVTVIDTAWFPDPVEVKRYIHDTMWVDVGDIITVHDTTYVPLPREYVTYHKDSAYTATVSGFLPRLEEITVYPQTQYITIQTEKITTVEKNPRFSIGVQAGYGITPAGFQPYLGIGGEINILSF